MSTALDSSRLPLEPAPRAVRLVALEFLDTAIAARERLSDPSDLEALHDLRVALRRLRSHLRAYADELKGSAGRAARRRLRRLARSTGASRDAEVHLLWLEGEAPTLASRQRPGLKYLVTQLEREKAAADTGLEEEMARSFASTTSRLGERLSTYDVTVHVRRGVDETPFAIVAAARVEEFAKDLQSAIGRVGGASDEEAAHRARIAGKRLRYLLEPLRASSDAIPPLVASLKDLQDSLGDLHDSHVFAPVIAASLEGAAVAEARQLARTVLAGDADPRVARRARRANPREGLLELGVRLHARGLKAFEHVTQEWMHEASAPFFERVAAVVDELRLLPAPSDREIERKYLLSGIPAIAQEHQAMEIEQGYLPGARVVERVRRVRGADAERYVRTIKGGLGLSRIEVEDEIDERLFRALWKLTVGRRVKKRRYVVPEGDLSWELDLFSDRDLVLAEVELPHEDTAVELPEWLAPYVVREVTGEAAYANVTLATRRDDTPVAIETVPNDPGPRA
ncbi:MAG TPA: CHAD domain-containing protein [Gemmatimonadaceae bacterium]|nr:CHAD domain-containing protein [Gemmatimonadaceae bacterium]